MLPACAAHRRHACAGEMMQQGWKLLDVRPPGETGKVRAAAAGARAASRASRLGASLAKMRLHVTQVCNWHAHGGSSSASASACSTSRVSGAPVWPSGRHQRRRGGAALRGGPVQQLWQPHQEGGHHRHRRLVAGRHAHDPQQQLPGRGGTGRAALLVAALWMAWLLMAWRVQQAVGRGSSRQRGSSEQQQQQQRARAPRTHARMHTPRSRCCACSPRPVAAASAGAGGDP